MCWCRVCIRLLFYEQCFVLSVVCLSWFRVHLGDHVADAYSSTGLVMALYVASMVSLCLPHFVEVRTLSMFFVLCLRGQVYASVVSEFGVKGES